MFKPLTVLVAGATGHQGGALARLLIQRGHRVLALTRHPASPAARELKARGARLVTGDFEDVDSLERAARRADALFAVATSVEVGPEAEVRHGLHLVEAARRARLRHLVYSSVAGADSRTGIPHFDSKHRIEVAVRASGLPFTLLGPTFFMENFLGPLFVSALRAGRLAMALPPHCGLQMVCMADIASFTLTVLEWPEEFLDRRVELASDEVTGEQAAAILSYVSDFKVRYEPLAPQSLGNEDMARMFDWLARVGFEADIAGLRRDFPEVGWHTFEQWARLQDWATLLAPSLHPTVTPTASPPPGGH